MLFPDFKAFHMSFMPTALELPRRIYREPSLADYTWNEFDAEFVRQRVFSVCSELAGGVHCPGRTTKGLWPYLGSNYRPRWHLPKLRTLRGFLETRRRRQGSSFLQLRSQLQRQRLLRLFRPHSFFLHKLKLKFNPNLNVFLLQDRPCREFFSTAYLLRLPPFVFELADLDLRLSHR